MCRHVGGSRKEGAALTSHRQVAHGPRSTHLAGQPPWRPVLRLQAPLLVLSGAVMEEEAAKLLGVKMCKFIPEHTRTLGNEFRCYVNYASGLDREL